MITSKLLQRTIVTCNRPRSVKVTSCIRPMSSVVPTFTTIDQGDTRAKFGRRLFYDSMMFGKSANLQLPESYEADIDGFKQGAIGAVAVVTRAMSRGNWNKLSGLVEPQCITKLKKIMDNWHGDARDLVIVREEDVFHSQVSFSSKANDENDIYLMIFSLPMLGKARSKKLKDPSSIVKSSDIILGYYRLRRKSSSDPWIITQVTQISGDKAWKRIDQYSWEWILKTTITDELDLVKVQRLKSTIDCIIIIVGVLITGKCAKELFYYLNVPKSNTD